MEKSLDFNFISTRYQFNELRKRVFFVIIALIIFRIGSFIPIPGIDTILLSSLLEKQQGTIIEVFNVFSGGALSRASIFALGIMPYISSSIIVQLLTSIYPALVELKKEGEAGRRRINKYIRYGTLILAIFQSAGIATGLPNMPGMQGLILIPGFTFYLSTITSLVTGTMFLMWLGEQITEKGIGNGVSLIIFSGIVAGLPSAFFHTIEQVRQGEIHFFFILFLTMFVFLITFFVVFVERGQRCIIVNYAKRQQGRRIYAAQNTHLPFKVNMAGVIPAIFASSIMLFPATIASWFSSSTNRNWITDIAFFFQPDQPIYMLLYACTIVFFCFFYTALVFNPRETAENLKKSGAFIPGIRPGEQTAKYIDKIITRLTLSGSLYISFICLIPEIMRSSVKVPFYFGGTSLLIVVVVIMDFMTQIQTLLISSQYDSALKKIKIKNRNH